MHECTCCGCDVDDHDPVFVEEDREGLRVQTGQFCQYGCLLAYVEAEGLAKGSACNVR